MYYHNNNNNMCPPEESRSDCSLDEERQGPVAHGDNANIMGYRVDSGADGACEELRLFSTKVSGGKVYVGDYPDKINLLERIAGGSFGEVYSALTADGKKVAAKVEPQGKGGFTSCVLHEGNVYRNLEGGPGMPKIYWYGLYNLDYGVLVMDLLGPTLQDLFVRNNGRFSLKTSLLLADQMLGILEHVHNFSYVHRDISPANFMIGLGENRAKVYLIDFGHAKKFSVGCRIMTRRNSLPKPKAVVGTPRFISINAHLSKQESSRDDMESLAYMLIYLLKGSLPWQGIQAVSMPDKLNKIAEKKHETPLEVVCKGIPDEFAVFLEYTRNMKQYEPGNFPAVKGLFRNLAAKHEISYDAKFDWTENDSLTSCSAEHSSKDLELLPTDSAPEVTAISH